ncbi:MAG: hypothetical protein ACE5J9_11680, partial [Methanosarcinales archaeon]
VTYVAYMVVGKVPVDLSADFNGNGRVDIGDDWLWICKYCSFKGKCNWKRECNFSPPHFRIPFGRVE